MTSSNFHGFSFSRGAVDVSEDATTLRVVSEIVSKYHLDPCQRYNLLERRQHSGSSDFTKNALILELSSTLQNNILLLYLALF